MTIISTARSSFITTGTLLLAVLLVATTVALMRLVPPPPSTIMAPASLDALPLAFIPNMGQYATEIKLQAQGRSSTLQFLQDEVVLHLPSDPAVHLRWEGANTSPTVVAGAPLSGVVNFIQGNDPATWRTDIPLLEGITYDTLYPGINLYYDGSEGNLKGTYTVAPYTDPSQIRWQFEGSTGIAVNTATDNLEVMLPSGKTITEQAPVAWQTINGVEKPIAVEYAVEGTTASFIFPNGYNPAYALIIDPTLLIAPISAEVVRMKSKGLLLMQAGTFTSWERLIPLTY